MTTVPSADASAPSDAATSLVDPMVVKYNTRDARPCSRSCAAARRSARSGGRTASDRLDLKADVHRGRRMSERADRDVVGTGRGKLRQPIQRHAAGDLDLRAPVHEGHGLAHLGGAEIVDEDHVGGGVDGVLDLRQTLRLDLDAQAGPMTARGANGIFHPAGEPDVVVLDEHGIEEASAVVGAAPGGNGVLLE